MAPMTIVSQAGSYLHAQVRLRGLDFIGVEQLNPTVGNPYTMDTQVRSSFPNLNVSGIPIFCDSFVAAGTCYGINVKYTSMYLAEDAAFDFSGFYSLVPLGQIGQQGVMVLGYDFISAKSSSGFWAYNIGNPAY